MKDLSDIVCAIAGFMIKRSLENVGRGLENLYVKSTAQGASPEEQAAFNPTLIAQVLEVAKQDNARMTVDWAIAIYDALLFAQAHSDTSKQLQLYIQSAQDKIHYLTKALAELETVPNYPCATPKERESRKVGTLEALRRAQEELLSLTQRLRDLQQPAPPIPGHPSSAWHPGSQFPGHNNLDGNLPAMP